MSLFQCENCGCCENTALAPNTKYLPNLYSWDGIEHLKGMELCSACGPTTFSDGGKTKFGKWHKQFNRIFLPAGLFKTNKAGNLEHIRSGSTDFRKYEIST